MNPAHKPLFAPLFFSANWSGWLLLLGLYSLLALGIAGFTVFAKGEFLETNTVLALSVLPALLLMAAAGGIGNSLARALSVLAARVGPRTGIGAVRRRTQRALLAAWLFSALPMVLLAFGSNEIGRFTVGPTLLALGLLIGLVGGTLWWAAVLPRVLLLLALALPVLRLDTGTLLHAWQVHLAVLLALPAATMALLPRSAPAARPTPGDLLKQWLQRSSRNYHGLVYRTPWQAFSAAYISCLMFWTGNTWQGMPLLADWGVDQDWRWGLRLVVLLIMANATLRCPGMQWRRLLAPGGMAREQLGLHVLRHSLQGLGWLLLAIVPLALLAQGLFSQRAWTDVLAAAPGQWLQLSAEMLLATVLVAIFAGATPRHPNGLIGIAIGVMLLLGLVLWLQPEWRAALHWRRGIAHLAGCLLASLALLPVLRRAWRNTDLARLAERVQNKQRELDSSD